MATNKEPFKPAFVSSLWGFQFKKYNMPGPMVEIAKGRIKNKSSPLLFSVATLFTLPSPVSTYDYIYYLYFNIMDSTPGKYILYFLPF